MDYFVSVALVIAATRAMGHNINTTGEMSHETMWLYYNVQLENSGSRQSNGCYCA